jgi:tRNA(Arg) A34 adenosine deaminase TadA
MNKHLSLALKIAEANPVLKLPKMGAVVVKYNKVVAVGWNSYKSHPMQARYGRHEMAICTHAEVAAISNALRNLTNEEVANSDLYVARITRTGDVGIAKPCEGCDRVIKKFKIRNVFWTVPEMICEAA